MLFCRLNARDLPLCSRSFPIIISSVRIFLHHTLTRLENVLIPKSAILIIFGFSESFTHTHLFNGHFMNLALLPEFPQKEKNFYVKRNPLACFCKFINFKMSLTTPPRGRLYHFVYFFMFRWHDLASNRL